VDIACKKKPEWLKSYFKKTNQLHNLKSILRANKLSTVCESAMCPNIGECFSKNRAVFMIMGRRCTRNCAFCAVEKGAPLPLDPSEPERVARTALKMGLRYVVITSVTRDDLADGGADHFAKTIAATRRVIQGVAVEVLTPDFKGNEDALDTVLKEVPDVFNHNLETVRRLTPLVRDKGANYERSLKVLEYVRSRSKGIILKSGIMVGMGEEDEEVLEALRDLSEVGVDVVTIGQYLMPSSRHLPVARYVPPSQFEYYKEYGTSIGIKHVFAAPLVRSSYMAEEIIKNLSPRRCYGSQPCT